MRRRSDAITVLYETSPVMGRETLLAVLCWLTLEGTSAKVISLASGVRFLDSLNAASVSRLYRNVPLGVYASAAPYGAYSFHAPTFVAPKNNNVPAKEDSGLLQNSNGFLRDSYGNKYQDSSSLAYRTTFPQPQQYVQLQNLPAHLSQPLVAASPNFQFKQVSPHFFGQAQQYAVPQVQSISSSLTNHFTAPRPVIYNESVKNPLVAHSQIDTKPLSQLQQSSNKDVYVNTFLHSLPVGQYGSLKSDSLTQYGSLKSEPKLQYVNMGNYVSLNSEPQLQYGNLANYGSLKTEPKLQYVNLGNYGSIKSEPNSQYVNLNNYKSEPKTQHVEKYASLKDEPKPQYVTVNKYETLKIEPKPEYVNVENYGSSKSEPKRHHAREQQDNSYEKNKQHAQQSQQSIQKENLIHAKVPDPTVTTSANGKTTVIIPTKPPLPYLDISLLEPLKFDNPLVPQVQHYLPRIHQATYYKLPNQNKNDAKKHKTEFAVQTTKSYDSSKKGNNKKDSTKKKQKKQRPRNQQNDEEEEHHTPSVTVKGDPDESPEFSYEINLPNYKETFTQKKVAYNKETQSDPVHINYEQNIQQKPVHYSYEKQLQNEPVHYSYVTTSKEPVQVKQIIYNNNEQPKQLVYHFAPQDKVNNHNEERVLTSPPSESEESINISNDSNEGNDEVQQRENHKERHVFHPESPKQNHHLKPEHRGEISSQKDEGSTEYDGYLPISPVQQERQYFQPITPEYEEDITILPTHKPHAPLNFNNENERDEPHHSNHNSRQTPQTSHKNLHSPNNYHETRHSSEPIVQEKSKRIIIQQESPDETQPDDEQLMADMIKQQEESEVDFEKAYKNSAIGFPAYDAPSIDTEKDIYNPETYGAPKYHKEYDIQHTPLQQYQADGDDFPKYTRSNYKDTKDKMQEEYFLDYAISKPESMLDRYKNKEDYYKMYSKQKPQKYFVDNEDKKKSAKYSIVPSFAYSPFQNKQQAAQKKSAPYLYEYDFAKEAPKDNSAFATRPDHRYKSKTQFVEPQYQYGFEPISIPHLLDSELAAMASNDNVESENPGTRKKVYKEKWYIKKTTTGKAAR